MLFLIKLFPEIIVKSRPVRKQLVNLLKRNIRHVLKEVDPEVLVTGAWDSVEVQVSEGHAQAALVELGRISGIQSILVAKAFPMGDLHAVYEHVASIWGERIKDKTFAVRIKRVGNHEFTSIDAERYVGGGLNQNFASAGVKLKNPDITVSAEIRQDTLYVLDEKHMGLGGFPLGAQDPVLTLISGGFDSPVAAWQMLRRGIPSSYLFFNLGGADHELGVKEVTHHLWQRYGRAHKAVFITVDFEPVVAEILEKVNDSQMGVILKRMMLRAADKIAANMSIAALVTGEAIGQVSSQTVPNLAVIDEVIDRLVIRPLVVSDKEEIIGLARKIDTARFAESMPEYCGVISRKPTTRAKLHIVQREEQKFDMSVLDQVVAAATVQSVADLLDRQAQQEPALAETISALSAGDVLLDIRHDDEREREPLDLPSDHMPFYRLQSHFAELPQDKRYGLYCAKGVMSQLHANHLVASGFKNVVVYRPE